MNKTTEALKLAEEALNAMLTHMGMDEDEWAKPTFNQAREALAAIREVLAESKPAPDGRIPKTVFTLEDIGKAAEMGRQAGMIDALAKPVKQEPVAHKWPLMGYGNVAIGGCKQPDGTSGLIYLDMGETREIDADTTDLFPVGSEADPSKLLACIYFKDGSAIQQTIDVLHEMQIETGYAAPVSVEAEWVDLTDDEILAIAIQYDAEEGISDVEYGNRVIAAFKEKNK